MINANERPRRKRLSWESRCEIVGCVRLEGGCVVDASARFAVHRSSVYRMLRRFDQDGWAGLRDRPPIPRSHPARLAADVERQVLAVRDRTRQGPVVIAAILELPASTVGKVLRRHGASRLPRPERDPVRRFERERPGELVHIDTKRLGRFHTPGKRILKDGVQRSPRAGWHHLHVAVDDHSRVAYCEVLTGQGKHACCAFLTRAVAWFNEQSITIERVLTDG